MLTEKSAAGGPAAQSIAFAHPAAQTSAQPHPSPTQQDCATPPQADQQQLRSPLVRGQHRNAFESLAASTYGCQQPQPSDHPFQEQWQPQHNMAGLGASTRDYHEPLMSTQFPQDEQRLASPREQPQPCNVFASFAARSRHLNERRQPSSTAPGQLPSSQRALPGDQTGGSSRFVQGVMQRREFPQRQQSGWMGQRVSTDDPHGTQGAWEPSFTFAPAGAALQSQDPLPAQVSPQHRAYSDLREPAQHSQSQRGRPVPASCQPAARTWQAPAHQHADSSQPVPLAQTGAGQKVGQRSNFHAYAPSFAAEQAPHAPEGATADQAEAQPQEQAQAQPQGFYSTWLQELSTSMHAHAPAWPGASASRAPSTAQAPLMAQGLHAPGQGRPAQTEANAASILSVASGVHPTLSRAPAPAHAALPAHPPGQAREAQQGLHS